MSSHHHHVPSPSSIRRRRRQQHQHDSLLLLISTTLLLLIIIFPPSFVSGQGEAYLWTSSKNDNNDNEEINVASSIPQNTHTHDMHDPMMVMQQQEAAILAATSTNQQQQDTTSSSSSQGGGGPCSTNPTSTYYEATIDCTGYYLCELGIQGQLFTCPGNGMLYDDSNQMCNWSQDVNCKGLIEEEPTQDEHGNPLPTKEPTHSPTQKPNELYEWDRNAHPRQHSKTIIGYYASWQWYDRNGLAEPTAFDYTKMTRINFAFFQITNDGYIFGTDKWADPQTLFGPYDWMGTDPQPKYCSWDVPNTPPTCMYHKYTEGLIYLAHAAGAEVYPSIGGWSLSDPFPAMAANPDWRANFARQCVELIKSYNFDGIDLDWEYPGYEPHSGTPDDTVNFNLLLDDIRAALDDLEAQTGRYYGITAALPCGPSIIAHQDIAHVGSVLTELNLMTYDFHGSWNNETGVNAPLYDQVGSPEFSVHGCVANWMAGGAPKEKINIGFPFYGRSFLGAEHLYEPHDGNDKNLWWMDEGVPQYYNIMDKMDELTSVRDEQTMTQYVYGSTGMVSFDDERAICDKTEYAQVNDLNGYIIWEISGDLMPDLSTPLLDAANAKLLNPDLDCASLDLSAYVKEVISEAHPDSPGSAATAGIGQASLTVYYPVYDVALCFNDGLEPAWMKADEMFSTLEECCAAKFSWNTKCEDDSPDNAPQAAAASLGMLYYPSTTSVQCLSDGMQPDWITVGEMFSTEEACCEYHFPSQDCVGNINDMKSLLYYPSSTQSICLSDGNQPDWVKLEDMFDTEEACCQHNYPSVSDCVGGADSATVPPSRTPTQKPKTSPPTQNPTSQPQSRSPTSAPSRHPITSSPSNNPTTANPTSRSPSNNPTPNPVTDGPTTRSPSRQPTPNPIITNTPTPPPTAKVMSSYQMIQAESTIIIPQTTGEPTRYPTPHPTRYPTPRPNTPNPIININNPVVQVAESPIAEAFLGSQAAAFATIETTPSIVEYNSPMKGQEQQTSPQIVQQSQQTKKGKLTKKQKQLKMIARNENLNLNIAREKKMAMKIARQQLKAKKQAAKKNAT